MKKTICITTVETLRLIHALNTIGKEKSDVDLHIIMDEIIEDAFFGVDTVSFALYPVDINTSIDAVKQFVERVTDVPVSYQYQYLMNALRKSLGE